MPGVRGDRVSGMERKLSGKERVKKNQKKRNLFQAVGALLLNANLPGFFTGHIYTGPTKGICVPVINCYSCPGAMGACPIGSIQASLTPIGGRLSAYVLGTLLLFALTVGRFFCGWLCPFGAFQGLLHRIRVKKVKVPTLLDSKLRYLKYALLFLMVFLLPMLARNGMGMSAPYFCKYICPAGVLEGGVLLSLVNKGVRAALGSAFLRKVIIAAVIITLSVFIYRPFCKYLCPMGAFYGLFSKISLYRYEVSEDACVHCGACSTACKMDIKPMIQPNSGECIRCGACKSVCPTGAIKNVSIFSRKNDKVKGEVK